MLRHPHINSARFISVIFSVIVLCICCSVLFTDGGAGLSDNGDFQRVMDANGLEMADSSHSRYIFKRFYTMTIDEEHPIKSLLSSYGEDYLYKSPHSHFIKASKLMCFLSNRISGRAVDKYDIFYLAALYICILSVAAYLIISYFKKPIQQIFAGLMFLILFCDTGHLLYFNSLYGEALQFVSLMIITGLILSFADKGFSYVRAVFLCLAIYYFGGSKLANIPLAILIAMCILVFITGLDKKRKGFLILCSSVVISALVFTYISIPAWMNEQTTYQSVFFGILKDSPSPEKDLEELSLPKEYASLAGTHAYMTQYPIDITSDEFRQNFYNKTGKADAVIFYMKHPVRFIKKASSAIKESVSIRPVYLGSSPHHRMVQTDKFSLWSKLRSKSPAFTNPYIVLLGLTILTVAFFIMIALCIKRKRFGKVFEIYLFLLLLICGIWANILLPVAGNGDADLLKHMYLFIHMSDLLLFSLLCMLISSLNKKGKGKHTSSLVSAVALASVLVLMLFPGSGNSYSTIRFGTCKGEPVSWILHPNEDGTALLISEKILFMASFDKKGDFGSNLWAESDIREYLNGEFLNNFTAEERNLICLNTHQVTLSGANEHLAECGTHPPYWRAARDAAADMYDETYRHTVTDMVCLPSALQYSRHLFDDCDGEFLLIDPYGASDSMVRYIDKNGIPIYTDASTEMGIRPVIKIKYQERD